MKETVLEKLKVLAESAKYDVSCASSGVTRKHRAGGVGSAAGRGGRGERGRGGGGF